MSGLSFVVNAAFPIDYTGGISSRHTKGANIGFLDGHAKYYPIGQVLANADPVGNVQGGGLVGGGGSYLPYVNCVNYNNAHVYWDRTAQDPQAAGAPATCTP